MSTIENFLLASSGEILAENGNSTPRTYIIKGPELHKKIPDVSLGQSIFNYLSKINPQDEAAVNLPSREKITFGEFLQNTILIAQGLKNDGCTPKDTIVICSENNFYFMEILIAAIYLAVPVMLINPRYTELELVHFLEISKPKLIFGSSKTPSWKLLQNLKKYGEKLILIDQDSEEKYPYLLSHYLDNKENVDLKNFKPEYFDPENTIAAILNSSGSTGLPKGVGLSHRNILVKFIHKEDPRFYFDYRENNHLSVLPLFHIIGMTSTLENFIFGHKTIFMEKFNEISFYETIESFKINRMIIVPQLMTLLVKSPLASKYDLSSLKEVIFGGAALSHEIWQLVQEKYNFDRLGQGYGMTETTCAVSISPASQNNPKSIGKLMAGVSAKVKDIITKEIVGPHQLGELCFKGPSVTRGYYNNHEANEEAFDEDGFFHSGDLGYFDDDEFFYIVDRAKEIIKYNSFQVSPAEIEQVLLKNPKIKDVGVIGIPDDLAGELPVAYVVPVNDVNLTEKEVKEFVAGQLSRYKHLHGGVRIVDEIPKTASGKVLRWKLKEIENKLSENL